MDYYGHIVQNYVVLDLLTCYLVSSPENAR
jgi:hypothetical protein